MVGKIVKYIKHPSEIVFFLQDRCNFRILSDEQYVKLCYKQVFGKKLDLENPQTFSEKLQWLKLYDRKPEYTQMVDKFEAKKYVAEKIGEKYIIPTLGIWNRFEDIDFDSLPQQFVLKCTHDSGGVVIVKDKSQMDIQAAKKKLEKSLKKNYYYSCREWPYKNVRPRIIAEQYIKEHDGLKDYKIYCFSGEPKVLLVVGGRETKQFTGDCYDETGKPLDLVMGFPHSAEQKPVPDSYGEMLRLARVLSAGIPHLRVDFYDIDGRVYFGELTFFCGSGMYAMEPDEWNYKLGDMLKLPLQ